jgi:hypothetical protein
MPPHRLAILAIALFLFAAGPGTVKASGQSQSQPPSAQNSASVSAQSQNRAVDPDAWDTPPEGLQDIQLKGFRDGIASAHKDFDKHREPNVQDRVEYRNPHLPAEQKEAYRDGFSRGYERGASHFIAGPDQPVSPLEQQARQPAHRAADTLPAADLAQSTEIQRRGFQDGMARARKDLDTHSQSGPDKSDESRQQKLPPDLQLQYLAAFRQGYDHFMSLQAGSPLDHH